MIRNSNYHQITGRYSSTTAKIYTFFSLFLFVFLEWSNQDVVERYLKPINMEHMAKAFLENNINGAVLLALEVYTYM